MVTTAILKILGSSLKTNADVSAAITKMQVFLEPINCGDLELVSPVFRDLSLLKEVSATHDNYQGRAKEMPDRFNTIADSSSETCKIFTAMGSGRKVMMRDAPVQLQQLWVSLPPPGRIRGGAASRVHSWTVLLLSVVLGEPSVTRSRGAASRVQSWAVLLLSVVLSEPSATRPPTPRSAHSDRLPAGEPARAGPTAMYVHCAASGGPGSGQRSRRGPAAARRRSRRQPAAGSRRQAGGAAYGAAVPGLMRAARKRLCHDTHPRVALDGQFGTAPAR